MDSNLELHSLVCCNESDQLASLLESGQMDVNEKDTDWGYRTPLHWAALKGNVECAKLLLDFGANGTARMANGATPAHCAAEAGKTAILKFADLLLILRLLVKSKVSVSRSDDFGDKPIDVARTYGQNQCVAYLNQVEVDTAERRRNRYRLFEQQKQRPPDQKSATTGKRKKGKDQYGDARATEVGITEDMLISDEDIDDDPIPHTDQEYVHFIMASKSGRKLSKNA